MLQSMGSERVRRDLRTEKQQKLQYVIERETHHLISGASLSNILKQLPSTPATAKGHFPCATVCKTTQSLPVLPLGQCCQLALDREILPIKQNLRRKPMIQNQYKERLPGWRQQGRSMGINKALCWKGSSSPLPGPRFLWGNWKPTCLEMIRLWPHKARAFLGLPSWSQWLRIGLSMQGTQV